MMNRISRILVTAVLLSTFGCVGSVRGANVTYVAQEDDVSRFRTTSVPKANDPDGDNVYGTAGYILYVAQVNPVANPIIAVSDPLIYDDGDYRTLASIPSFLSLQNNGQIYSVGGFGYPLIDDPSATPGVSVPDIKPGLAIAGPVDPGTEGSLLDIVIGAAFPTNGLRIGVMLYGNEVDGILTTRLTQTGGIGSGGATADLVGTPDTYFQFFDITGAAAGDRFTLLLNKIPGQGNANLPYIGLTFDNLRGNAVPEPGSLTLVGLGVAAAGLSGLRRRRSR